MLFRVNKEDSYSLKRKQSGFTLIEIVMVLVLLGILAAVAVPKYFDLQEQAEEHVLDATEAEVQARFMGYFSQYLLNGSPCGFDIMQYSILSAVSDLANNNVKINIVGGDVVDGLKLSLEGQYAKRTIDFKFPTCSK